MSTTEIVMIYKTKNMSKLLGKKGSLLGTYLVETVSCPLEAPPPPPPQKIKNVNKLLGKKGSLLGMYLVETVSCPLEAPPSHPKK